MTRRTLDDWKVIDKQIASGMFQNFVNNIDSTKNISMEKVHLQKCSTANGLYLGAGYSAAIHALE